jgi:hypothetical protein
MSRILLCLVVLGGAIVNRSFAGQPGESAADEAAIRKADEAYVKAFNKHDAKALADAWSPEAVYLSRVTGRSRRPGGYCRAIAPCLKASRKSSST